MQLQRDDGTSNHLPAGSPLASATISDPLNTSSGTSNGAFRLITFDKAVQLQAGQLYHVVFSNIDSNPSTNWVSLDCLYNPAKGTRQASVSNLDWAAVWNLNGSWSNVETATPILEIYFNNGQSQGNGYIDSWGSKSISGGNKVRETFTVADVDRTVSALHFRVAKGSSSGNLNVRLERSDGTLIEQGTVPASSLSSAMNWATYKFRTNHSLTKGQNYNLVLSSNDGSFSSPVLQEGAAYGFTSSAIFKEGRAQYTTGSSWQNWGGRTDLDIQMFFSGTGSAVTRPGVPPQLRVQTN